MLTARDEEPDRVAGLEVGADDYLSKPFSPRELAARIKAVLRRTEPGHTGGAARARRHHARSAGAREVTRRGEPVELTSKEFDLLACLIENPGIVFSREQLLDRVWGMTYVGGTRTVDVHVAQLRRKLGRPSVDPHRARRGLQGRPAVSLQSLRTRLFAAIAIVALLSRRARARRSARCSPAEPSSGTRSATSRPRPTCSPSASASRSLPFARLTSARAVPRRSRTSASSASRSTARRLLPPEPAASVAAARRLDGTLTVDGKRYVLRRAARRRAGLRAAAAGELDHVGLASAPRRPRSRRRSRRRLSLR